MKLEIKLKEDELCNECSCMIQKKGEGGFMVYYCQFYKVQLDHDSRHRIPRLITCIEEHGK